MNRSYAGGMFLGLTFACLLGLTHPAWGQTPAADSAKEETGADQKIPEVQDALARFRAGDFDGAKGLLDKAVQEHPELPPARVIMAAWFSQLQQVAMVYNQLEAAVVELPGDPEPYRLLGDLAGQGGRWAEADLCYRKAAELLSGFQGNPKRKALLTKGIGLGQINVAEARQNWAAVEKGLSELLAAGPQDPALLQRLARVLYKQKKTEDALARLKEAKAADPKLPSPEATMAGLCQQDGDVDEAGKWMTAAIQAAPKDVGTRIIAADWALGTGQFKTAQQQIDAALQLSPDNNDAILLRGMLAMFQNDYATASKNLQIVLTRTPGHLQAANNLAAALAEQDEAARQKALEIAQANAQQHAKQPDAQATLGWVLFKLGRVEEAESALRRAVELSQGQRVKPDTLYYIAHVAVFRKRLDEARRALEMALRSKAPFSKQAAATELLKEIQRPAATPAGEKPASTSTESSVRIQK